MKLAIYLVLATVLAVDAFTPLQQSRAGSFLSANKGAPFFLQNDDEPEKKKTPTPPKTPPPIQKTISLNETPPPRPTISLSPQARKTIQLAASTIKKELVDPLLSGDIEKGVSPDAIKGAALTGASLTLLAGQGLVLTTTAGLGAAYVALSPGVGGRVVREIGGAAWESAQAAAELYEKYGMGTKISQATEKVVSSTMEALQKAQRQATLDENNLFFIEGEQQETETVDVSIPYDAAARLAFAETGLDEAEYLAFKEEWEAQQVADVTKKTLAKRKAIQQAEEKKRKAEEAKAEKEEEAKRKAEEAKAKKEEEARLADEQAKKEEEERLAAKQAKKEEEARLAAEEAKKEEEARLAAEEAKKEEEARLAAEEAKKEEEARLAAEEAKKEEEARLAAEEAKKEEEARLAAEQAKKKEEERLAAEQAKKEEEARLAAEEAKKEEEARLAAEEAQKEEEERLAAEQAKKEEEERLAAEQAKKEEQARLAAKQAKKKEEDEEARLAAEQEAEKALLAEEMKKQDEERLAEEARKREEARKQEEEKLKGDIAVEEDDDLQATIRLAEQILDGTIAGLDDAIADTDVKEEWDSAGRLAQDLKGADEAEEEDDDDIDSLDDEEDMAVLAQAAREAVEKFEAEMKAQDATKAKQKELWDSEMITDEDFDYDEDLEELREEYDDEEDEDMEELEQDLTAQDFSGDVDLEELGRQARAAVEQFESGVVEENEMQDDIGKAAREAVVKFNSQEVDPDDHSVVTDWSKFTVAQLRQELKSRGLKTIGRKAELIATLTEYDFDSQVEREDTGEGVMWDASPIEEPTMADIEEAASEEPDLEELARAAREAVELFEQQQQEEEVDEDVEVEEDSSVEYEAMTVNELKDELRNRGLKISGRKAELIERLRSSP